MNPSASDPKASPATECRAEVQAVANMLSVISRGLESGQETLPEAVADLRVVIRYCLMVSPQA